MVPVTLLGLLIYLIPLLVILLRLLFGFLSSRAVPDRTRAESFSAAPEAPLLPGLLFIFCHADLLL